MSSLNGADIGFCAILIDLKRNLNLFFNQYLAMNNTKWYIIGNRYCFYYGTVYYKVLDDE
jgi:hypothetical protein